MKRGRTYILGLLIMLLAPLSANAQWSFDVGTVEAYINDHKQQRSLLLARSTLEHSNKLLHEYSRKEMVGYKELNSIISYPLSRHSLRSLRNTGTASLQTGWSTLSATGC